MKKFKINIILITLIGIGTAVHGQEFRTDESIGSQIKNGTVPGTRISPEQESKKAGTDTEDPKKISVPVKQQLLNGTYPGLTVSKSAPGSITAKEGDNKPLLASDVKPANAEKKIEPASALPTQEGKVVKANN